MAFARLGCGLCVTSLHASTRVPLAEDEIVAAGDRAVELGGEAPLILGGDFNLRPHSAAAFGTVADRFGLTGITAPDAIDHLLLRGATFAEPPTAWPPERRELPEDGLRLRLSDHAPVEALVELTTAATSTEGAGRWPRRL